VIQFEWPWIFLALLVPFLLRLLIPPAAAIQEAALKVPSFEAYTMSLGVTPRERVGHRGLMIFAAFVWFLLVCAAARPIWHGEPVELPVSGRDLMLAVDISGSMQTEDIIQNGEQVSRLAAVKKVAGEFIQRRVGDRVGLILFGSQAYVQTPLTFDRKTVLSLLQDSAIGLAGKQTAIGDAIGLTVKRLLKSPGGNRVLVLLTDGASNTGELTPLKAAELAAKEGLTIYTVGIGADEMVIKSFFGRQKVNPSADLDEKTLDKIAQATGGKYFRARDGKQLEKIYSILDRLQPITQDKQTFRPQRALFYWPLGVAILLAGLMILARVSRR